MKRSFVMLMVAAIFTVSANAQFLNRLTDRAIQAAERGVSKAVEKSVEKTTEKATEKVLDSAEKAVEKQVDKAADAIMESANQANESANEINRLTDSIRVANGQPAAAQGAGLAGLMGSYMTLMGAGTPTLEDKGDEMLLSWDYVGFKLEWLARFSGDNCSLSKMMYTHQTPEMAIQYYREQIDGLDEDEAKKWSVDGKTVTEDNTDEYKDKDKIAIKAAMQQIVLSMGGKLE
ncbi:MAG: hypothetical protein J6W99_04840 [Bacteroidaceae bacterium]|nr:hypothetical protein [Bacteroidaceae bacterium]